MYATAVRPCQCSSPAINVTSREIAYHTVQHNDPSPYVFIKASVAIEGLMVTDL